MKTIKGFLSIHGEERGAHKVDAKGLPLAHATIRDTGDVNMSNIISATHKKEEEPHKKIPFIYATIHHRD